MRALILIAAAGFAISACNKDQAVENTANIDEAVTAEGISSNDTTVIDAATAEAANMAADVDYTLEEENDSGGNVSAADREPGAARTSPRRVVREVPAENVSDAGNTTENAQ